VCKDQLICPILYVFQSETSFKLQFYSRANTRGSFWELNVHNQSYDLNWEPKLEGDHSQSYDLNWELRFEGDHNWSYGLNQEPKLLTIAGAAILIESKKLELINEPKLKGYLN
jgi:hypothetical protein